MRALAALAVLLAVALLASGCEPEDPAQRYVREQVQAHLVTLGGYDPGRTACTGSPRPWFVERATGVYVCAGHKTDGRCDWFTAGLEGQYVTVALDRRDAGCVLPQ